MGMEENIDYIQKIIQFNNDANVQKLRTKYFSKSFSEILSVSRRELSHSSFLTWIFDEVENPTLSKYALQKLFEILAKRCKIENKNEYDGLFPKVLSENYTINTIKSINEKLNIDILIESELKIDDKIQIVRFIIENKVDSKEHSNQTQRYFKDFQKEKKSGEINFYIYLSVLSNFELEELTEPECECKNFIQINYQMLVDYLFENALNQNISERTKFIIEEYISSLSYHSLNTTEERKKSKQIMAMNQQEKQLLTNFWSKNKDLIVSAIYANSINEQLDEEERQENKELYEKINEIETKGSGIGKRIRNHFALLVENGLIDSDLVLELTKEEYSKEKFKISGLSFLIKQDKSIRDSAGYPRYAQNPVYSINGVKYLIWNQWTEKNEHLYDDWASRFKITEQE